MEHTNKALVLLSGALLPFGVAGIVTGNYMSALAVLAVSAVLYVIAE